MAGEFDLIANYFNWSPVSDGIEVSVGDDAAVLNVSPNHELLVSVDTLVAGIHYPLETAAADIGYKSLMVNLSDIAAMGGEPKWFTLALTLPAYDQLWLAEFSAGLQQAASEYGVSLVGGDTTRGSTPTITIQIMGEALRGQSLKRSTAEAGDLLYITHTLGDAAAGLLVHQANQLASAKRPLTEAESTCIARLNRPTARINESRVIRQYASACIDISDGLLQDLTHILDASNVGAVIDTTSLTVSEALSELYSRDKCLELALSGGDDYELLFSIPQRQQEAFEAQMHQHAFFVQRIGTLNNTRSIKNEKGEVMKAAGFQHF